MSGATCAGFPSVPSGGSMLKTCSTETTAMNNASFAKCRPGQILDRIRQSAQQRGTVVTTHLRPKPN